MENINDLYKLTTCLRHKFESSHRSSKMSPPHVKYEAVIMPPSTAVRYYSSLCVDIKLQPICSFQRRRLISHLRSSREKWFETITPVRVTVHLTLAQPTHNIIPPLEITRMNNTGEWCQVIIDILTRRECSGLKIKLRPVTVFTLWYADAD